MSQEPKKEEQRKSQNILIGVVAFIAVILVLAFLGPKEANGPDVIENGESDDQEEVVKETNTATNFEYLLPEEWDGLARAERNIQSLDKGQVIIPGIVADPTDDNIVYFASAAIKSTDPKNTQAEKNLLSIYKYNTENYQFERLFKERGALLNDDGKISEFRVIGYDSGKLLIASTSVEDRTKCSSMYATGKVHWSFVIEDPYNTAKAASIPTELLDKLRIQQEQCQIAEGFGELQ